MPPITTKKEAAEAPSIMAIAEQLCGAKIFDTEIVDAVERGVRVGQGDGLKLLITELSTLQAEYSSMFIVKRLLLICEVLGRTLNQQYKLEVGFERVRAARHFLQPAQRAQVRTFCAEMLSVAVERSIGFLKSCIAPGSQVLRDKKNQKLLLLILQEIPLNSIDARKTGIIRELFDAILKLPVQTSGNLLSEICGSKTIASNLRVLPLAQRAKVISLLRTHGGLAESGVSEAPAGLEGDSQEASSSSPSSSSNPSPFTNSRDSQSSFPSSSRSSTSSPRGRTPGGSCSPVTVSGSSAEVVTKTQRSIQLSAKNLAARLSPKGDSLWKRWWRAFGQNFKLAGWVVGNVARRPSYIPMPDAAFRYGETLRSPWQKFFDDRQRGVIAQSKVGKIFLSSTPSSKTLHTMLSQNTNGVFWVNLTTPEEVSEVSSKLSVDLGDAQQRLGAMGMTAVQAGKLTFCRVGGEGVFDGTFISAKTGERLTFEDVDAIVLQMWGAVKAGKDVLVNCFGGAERSAAILICFFIKICYMSLAQAIDWVHENRWVAKGVLSKFKSDQQRFLRDYEGDAVLQQSQVQPRAAIPVFAPVGTTRYLLGDVMQPTQLSPTSSPTPPPGVPAVMRIGIASGERKSAFAYRAGEFELPPKEPLIDC